MPSASQQSPQQLPALKAWILGIQISTLSKYLAYHLFTVRIDNNPLTCILIMPIWVWLAIGGYGLLHSITTPFNTSRSMRMNAVANALGHIITHTDAETLSWIVQVIFSLLVDPTWTILDNVSCLTTQNSAVDIFTMGGDGVFMILQYCR